MTVKVVKHFTNTDNHSMEGRRALIFHCHQLPVRMLWKAVSTLVESSADVSMKESPSFSANAFASSVGTDRK